MKDGFCVNYLHTYLLKPLLFLFCICNSSCSNAQEDKLLLENKSMQIKVYQSDLDKYITLKAIKDTAGKSAAFIWIISNAQVRMRINSLSNNQTVKISYEKAVTEAEQYFKLMHAVDKVLVIKHERKMYLLKAGKTVKTFSIALGPNPIGQKEYEGDGKTPEGIYTLDWQRWETPVFHSFHISYPNKIDSVRAKSTRLIPGSNIMVHGTSKGIKKKKDWTNGCIGINNKDMIAFRTIVFQDTPIEIIK